MFTIRARVLKSLFNSGLSKEIRCISKSCYGTDHKYKFSVDQSKLNDVKVAIKDKYIVLESKQDVVSKYPSIWLRDNCQCPKCFDPISRSRTINWDTFDVNVYPKAVQMNQPESQIKIDWSDNHESLYTLNWLKERDFSEEGRSQYINTIYKPRHRLWGPTEFKDVFRTFKYDDIINKTASLKSWLWTLATNGVAIIEDTPLEQNVSRDFINRIGFQKRTHYGAEFSICDKENANNAAYLSTTLQYHTDLPYYEYKPGVTFLHCLEQTKSKGGKNLFTDGFNIAAILREKYPDAYKVLTNTLVNWSDYGEENGRPFHKVYRGPVISADLEGKVHRVDLSVAQRDSYFSVDPSKVDAWYKALGLFVQLIQSEAVTIKMKRGDLLTFDNLRMVHNRTAYVDEGENVRHLIGSYIDWDEVYSLIRILNNKSYPSSHE